MSESYLLELAGWIAMALNVVGNLMLIDMSVRGWIVRLAVNVIWVPYSVYTEAWALLVNHLIFAAINVRGWVLWNRRARAEAKP